MGALLPSMDITELPTTGIPRRHRKRLWRCCGHLYDLPISGKTETCQHLAPSHLCPRHSYCNQQISPELPLAVISEVTSCSNFPWEMCRVHDTDMRHAAVVPWNRQPPRLTAQVWAPVQPPESTAVQKLASYGETIGLSIWKRLSGRVK
jgi:hypothetical protein